MPPAPQETHDGALVAAQGNGHEAEIEYLRSVMVPVLVKGLTQMAKLKPPTPYKWFADFLLQEQEYGVAPAVSSSRPGSAVRSLKRRPSASGSRRSSFVLANGVSWSNEDPAAHGQVSGGGDAKVFTQLSVMTSKKLDDVELDPESSVPVLGDNVLKGDHFANIWKLPMVFDGVPNFRKVDDMPVYGVGQATETGIKAVAEYILNGESKHSRILWFNMRNEPICFINNKPHSPRKKGHLNDNIENPGISVYDLEEMEKRLAIDVLEGAEGQQGIFLMYNQNKDMTNVASWEHVAPETVKTLREIYDTLQKDGYALDYVRNPILDEKAPDDSVIDETCRLLEDVEPDTALVFNCQMGRGRTTTGMVLACLIWRAVNQKEPEGVAPEPDLDNPNYNIAEFKTVLELVEYLGHDFGLKMKQQVDECCDACFHMQNLRTAIEECKVEAEKSAGGEGRPASFWIHRGINYLERYFMLIAVSAYLTRAVEAGEKFSSKPFSAWMAENPRIREILGAATLD
mmetsp:Transcript_46161/g.75319  ORF Transcript_46161/g.75319 Transcript_46161/m.75319 type:complete len:514 (+) Transcript_46161:137-1678(+)|eukprot:CAMPEP_0184650732 /NCGR_PEP_ID=MMETSP0308-20130426/8299_1 /TAXON_ID=38269 /ORGANISM="Gloeochaete witrockiana, Strain SAG 46.84" /LENGTH=513 /DNA_ID=CAMNT_0027084493 /DNA_START=63 /DNA_END=1604 /DNA_ORIENTATION=+